MKNYYKFFYIFAIALLIILIAKNYILFVNREYVKQKLLSLQSESIVNLINSFRDVYQKNFVKYHIEINSKTVHLVPITLLPEVYKEFANKNGHDIEIKVFSDRPRDPENTATPQELKVIEYLKKHKTNGYLKKLKDTYIYYEPLYIKQTCLKCHTTKKEAPKYIREHYDKAYGYKLGDLRGVISIKISDSKFLEVVTKSFYKRIIEDILLYILILGIFWFLIKKIEKMEKEHIYKLEQEKLKAQRSEQTKSEFLANMSHEIRTPLNAMVGFVTLLKEKNLDKESKEYIDIMKKSSDVLLNVINDILDLSKVEAGKLHTEQNPFYLKEEIDLLYNLFEVKAEEKGIKLIKKEENTDVYLISDSIRIKQIISNLLSNAVKFTPKDKNIYFEVKYDEKEEKLFIKIKDEGIGIDKDKLSNIFEAFSQEDTSTTRKYGGTGLGLTISYQLVKLLGGELNVKSEKGEGSEFYFSIPVKKTTPIKKEQKIRNKNFKYTILLVEDNKANQMFLGIVLKKLGIKYDIANDGIEAVELYKKNYKKYDLILMDENMPNMSGSEATIEIRKFEENKKLKKVFIVAVTANALSGDKEKFINIGMNEYITKPIDIEKLKKVLDEYNNYRG